MRDLYDVRVYVDPPEDMRRGWKVQRDCSRRGYTTDEIPDELLDRREADAEAYVRPQRRHADLVISFMPGDRGDQEHLDAKVTLRPGLVHPDLSAVADRDEQGVVLVARGPETVLGVPGTIRPEHSAAIEETIWEGMHFASHLRTERLGEFTVGTQLHRSESLAIIQLLVLYQLVTARAAVAIGAIDARTDRDTGEAPSAGLEKLPGRDPPSRRNSLNVAAGPRAGPTAEWSTNQGLGAVPSVSVISPSQPRGSARTRRPHATAATRRVPRGQPV